MITGFIAPDIHIQKQLAWTSGDIQQRQHCTASLPQSSLEFNGFNGLQLYSHYQLLTQFQYKDPQVQIHSAQQLINRLVLKVLGL